MKMRINKACDLSSISVFPPHSRRLSDAGRGQGAASQSQQSFSQGMTLSQLSQSSFEENLAGDQRFSSQDRDNASKRISTLAPITSTREDSQLQLSRTSNNVFRRWSSSSAPDNKCQVSEELEHRFRLMESTLNRMGLILDSVQNDVMQVNRTTKEVSLDTDGIRQKMILLENSIQQLLKGEEDIKASLDGSLKTIPDQVIKDIDQTKLNVIESAVTGLPQQIDALLLKIQHEVCGVFTRDMEKIGNDIKSLKSDHLCHIRSPALPSRSLRNDRLPFNSPMKKRNFSMQQSQKSQMPNLDISTITPHMAQKGWTAISKLEPEFPKALKPKLTGHNGWTTISKTKQEFSEAVKPRFIDSKHKVKLKEDEIPLRSQKQDFRVVIESDESDGDVPCLIVKKETGRSRGRERDLFEEAREESMRILTEARKKRRRQNNTVIWV